jgi:hypothetical protein
VAGFYEHAKKEPFGFDRSVSLQSELLLPSYGLLAMQKALLQMILLMIRTKI